MDEGEHYIENTKFLRALIADYTEEEYEDYKVRLMENLSGNNLNTALEMAAKFREGT